MCIRDSISTFKLRVPALRERPGDILPLVARLLARHAPTDRVLSVNAQAQAALQAYSWPGNVRELENLIERGLIIASPGQMVDVGDLFAIPANSDVITVNASGALQQGVPANIEGLFEDLQKRGLSIDALEDGLIQQAVSTAGGNLSAAARLLGLTRPQLSYRLQKIKNR